MTGRASRLDFWVEERSYTHSASWEVYDSTPSEGGVFANNDIDMPVWFNRGYTGHACPELGRREHLQEFDLINMNGRLYDPIPGRMLSADNHVQSPGNSQSYNRYAYVMNNPMKYTDPSGEFWIAAAAAMVAGISYLVGASRNDWEMDPRKWTSGDGVGIGFTTNSAGTTNLYGFGNAGGVSWTGGANVNGGFGGGFSTFGQASYNQMPSAGTGSINWDYVNNQRNWDNARYQFESLGRYQPNKSSARKNDQNNGIDITAELSSVGLVTGVLDKGTWVGKTSKGRYVLYDNTFHGNQSTTDTKLFKKAPYVGFFVQTSADIYNLSQDPNYESQFYINTSLGVASLMHPELGTGLFIYELANPAYQSFWESQSTKSFFADMVNDFDRWTNQLYQME